MLVIVTNTLEIFPSVLNFRDASDLAVHSLTDLKIFYVDTVDFVLSMFFKNTSQCIQNFLDK